MILRMGADLVPLLEAQRDGCRIGGSSLYALLLDGVMHDVQAGGPCRAALEPYADEPRSAALVLRFLAAVHEIVLEGGAHELARHYPSVGGEPGPDAAAVFVATVAHHRDRITARTADPVQTNEVGRSAALLGGYLAIAAGPGRGMPLRLLEVGASAGLNLRFDHFRYEAGGQAFGPASSPVRFAEPWDGPSPRLDFALEVRERRGCDLRPLDPSRPADRRWLRACVWADQPHRLERLDAALQVAATVPAVVEEGDAPTWLEAQLARPTPGSATVVVHSIVAQYLPPAARERLDEVVRDAGRRATPGTPVAWLRMEPASSTEAEVRLTSWPAPTPVRSRLLAHCAFHGPPIRWHPDA